MGHVLQGFVGQTVPGLVAELQEVGPFPSGHEMFPPRTVEDGSAQVGGAGGQRDNKVAELPFAYLLVVDDEELVLAGDDPDND
jgi:hypothetical protein